MNMKTKWSLQLRPECYVFVFIELLCLLFSCGVVVVGPCEGRTRARCLRRSGGAEDGVLRVPCASIVQQPRVFYFGFCFVFLAHAKSCFLWRFFPSFIDLFVSLVLDYWPVYLIVYSTK